MSQTKAQLIGDLTQALEFITTASTPADGLYLKTTNQIALATNSVDRITVGTSELVINESGASVDFRVEGDTNANLLFVDASTDRVGIGTNTPDSNLEIVNSTASANNSLLKLHSSANTSSANLILEVNNGSTAQAGIRLDTSNKLHLQTFGGGALNNVLTLSGSNVGVGATSPSEEFVVRADAPSVQLESSNASGRTHGIQSNSDGNFFIYDGTAGVNRITLNSSGDVGIGITNPGFRLEVESSANDIARFVGPNSGNIVFRNATNNEVILHTGTSDALIFGTNGNNERLRILPGGGLTFNGDTAAANALDDYEEGSWVPTMSGLSNTPQWANIAGRYTKIGRLVHLHFVLQPGNTNPQFTSTTAKFQIENVPFAPGNNNAGYWAGVGNVRWQSVDWENSAKNMNSITPDYVTIGVTSQSRLEIIFVEANNVWSEARNSLFHNDAFIFEGTVTYHTDL